MNQTHSNIIIIGGGLTGLTAAYQLKKAGISSTIIEARNRLGGRIQTIYKNEKPLMELGATWLGKKHTHLVALLKELNIGIFEQHLGQLAFYEPFSTSPPQLVTLPPNNDPSFRIKGGSSNMIHTLSSHLDKNQIKLDEPVYSIHFDKNIFYIKTKKNNYSADFVISTLPPKLLVSSIDINPKLPSTVSEVAHKTHTWMGESIKVGLTFSSPFWRTKNSSSTIFSNVGPISEMYDHSNDEASHFGLKGFMNSAYYVLTKEQRLEKVLTQLRKYFGEEVNNYLTYEEGVWRKETFSFADYQDHILPHQNNGHPVFSQKYMDGKFFIGGAETAQYSPGYMDGAVQSGKHISQLIQNQIS